VLKLFRNYNAEIQLVLITTLLSNVGIFMVIPFLAIYLNELNTVSTVDVGIIVGIAFWCQKAGSLLGGLLSDFVHVKKTMLLGLAIRIPGYILVGYVTNFYLLIVACSLIGLGSSIYLPAAKSFLIDKCNSDNKVEVLSARMIFSNIGVAIGPVIGLIVFEVSPIWLFSSVGVIFSFLLLLNLKLKYKPNSCTTNLLRFSDFNQLLKNKLMISISVFMFIFMVLYMQIEITIPMFSKELFGQNIVSLIFILNALIVVFFQMPISRWTCKENNNFSLMIGFIAFSISFLLLSTLETSYLALFLSVIIFSFAEIIFQIRLDYEATNVKDGMIATTFGIMSLAGAFGGLFGSYIGTYLYSNEEQDISVWAILTIMSLILSLLSLLRPKTNNEVHYA